MESLFLGNLGSPPLLFFFLGVLAVLVRSDLEIPSQIAKALAVYLLFAIGFKGGVALAQSPMDALVARNLLAALALATVMPLYVFYLLRRRLSLADAAAVAATYGSISAVTFVTCTSYLDLNQIPWSGYLVASMALMESPAIIVGILLYRLHTRSVSPAASTDPVGLRWRELLRESCLNGSVVLIVGSMVIGFIADQRGVAQLHPFVSDLFTGLLCLFLLDMGIVATRRLQDLRTSLNASPILPLVGFALVLPIFNALVSGTLAWQLQLTEGDALLLTVLGASASYIAVPAAMRLALPEANPSVYLSMSLAITFPLNLTIGIPLYHQVLRVVLG